MQNAQNDAKYPKIKQKSSKNKQKLHIQLSKYYTQITHKLHTNNANYAAKIRFTHKLSKQNNAKLRKSYAKLHTN